MLLDALGLILIALLSSARLAQVFNGEVWAFPLLFHSLLAVILLLLHNKTTATTQVWKRLIAWGSAFMPLAMQLHAPVPLVIQLMSLSGVIFSLWGLWCLGRSFDIVPADRGLVQKGPYRFLRHPIYAGELFSVAIMGLVEISVWNILVLLLLVLTIVMRISWEEKIIKGYPVYANQVQSRLLPGIW